MKTSSRQNMSWSPNIRLRVLVVVVAVLATTGLFVTASGVVGESAGVSALAGGSDVDASTQSSGYAGISNEDPARGTTLDSSEDVTITFTVDYDTGDEEPGYISVSFGEDMYEQPHKEVDIDQQSGSKEITVTQSVHSDWDQAVLDVTVWPEAEGDTYLSIDGDSIEYDVDGSSGGGGELPNAEINCEIDIVEGESFYCTGSDSEAPSGYVSQYEWEFDGNVEYGESAQFTADSHGSWWVYLTVTDNEGNTDTTSEIIDVDEANVAPDADISCDSSVTIGESVSCDAYGTTDQNDNVESYDWTFGTEGSDFGVEAEHAFSEPGTYPVEVTVTDAEGASDIASQTVTVEPTRPEIDDLRIENTVMVGETTELSVVASDPGGLHPLSYSWDFAGDTSSQESFTVSPDQVGELSGEVRVENSEGVGTTESFTIDVEDKPPEVGHLSVGSSSVRAGSAVDLTASVSDPAGRDIGMSYEWNVNEETYQGTSASVTLREVGVQEITFTVENEYGTATSKTETVTVTNAPPSIDVPTRDSLDAATSESFAVSVENPSSGATDVIMSVDGDVVTRDQLNSHSGTVRLSHRFSPGDKNIKIEARDDHGGVASKTFQAEVDGDAPVVDNYAPNQLDQGISTGETIEFSVAPTHPTGQSVEVNWYVDGTEAKTGSESFSKTFTENGYQVIEAAIVDEYGVETTQTWSVQADTFSESPRIEDHSTAEQLSVEREVDALTFSFRNPEANERSAVVEIRASNPSGISIVGVQNVDETDQAQSAVVREVAPGDQEELSLEVTVTDDSLIGKEIAVSYEVLYHPADSSEASVQVFEDSLDLYVGQDMPAENTSGTDDSIPGFGALAALLSLILVLIVLKKS